MSLEDLLTQSRQLAYRATRLSETTTHLQLVDEAAASEIETYKSDPSAAGRAYALLGAAQHRSDIAKVAAEKRRTLSPRLNIHTYEAEHQHRQVEESLGAFIAEAMAPPTAEVALLRMTRQLGLNIDQVLSLGILDQITTANLRSELRAAPPSRRLDLYREACNAPDLPVNAITIRILEKETIPYTNAGPLPESEVEAAATFSRLKQETANARVPTEVATVRKALDDAAAIIKTARRLGATPMNPSHPGNESLVAEIAEQERQEAV